MISFQKKREAGLTYVNPLPNGLHVYVTPRVPFGQRVARIFERVLTRQNPLNS
ncbi:hypothetical protein LJR129_005030 [Acidovorax sp. LjRoot129]|uniref:hypothetical protein n=1 Tax=unclassified Acidovorax TaxID=2684926 RepID=UPI003ECD1AB9